MRSRTVPIDAVTTLQIDAVTTVPVDTVTTVPIDTYAVTTVLIDSVTTVAIDCSRHVTLNPTQGLDYCYFLDTAPNTSRHRPCLFRIRVVIRLC